MQKHATRGARAETFKHLRVRERQERQLLERLDVLLHACERLPAGGVRRRTKTTTDDDSWNQFLVLVQSSRLAKPEGFVVVCDGAGALLLLRVQTHPRLHHGAINRSFARVHKLIVRQPHSLPLLLFPTSANLRGGANPIQNGRRSRRRERRRLHRRRRPIRPISRACRPPLVRPTAISRPRAPAPAVLHRVLHPASCHRASARSLAILLACLGHASINSPGANAHPSACAHAK